MFQLEMTHSLTLVDTIMKVCAVEKKRPFIQAMDILFLLVKRGRRGKKVSLKFALILETKWFRKQASYIMHGAFLSHMIQGFFFYLQFCWRHMKKELAQSKGSCFSAFVVDQATLLLQWPRTLGWFDFPKDMKAIISHGTSFQLFSS